MLIDFVNEQRTGFTYPSGISADEALDPLRKRLAQAQAFVVDRDAVAMAASVSLSKPSSIVAALPWVRLPHETMWIEFANQDLRSAMADLGPPNIQDPNTVSRIERSGFLLRQEDDTLVVDYVHLDSAPNNIRVADLAPVQVSFKIGGEAPGLPPDLRPGRGGAEIAKGRMRQHLRLLSQDPKETAAALELAQRFSWTLHPDMSGIAADMVRMTGPERVDQIQENQAREAYRLFTMMALPVLILLNCRNAVETEQVDAPAKLNKKRAARGKPPLVEHKVVKVRLSAAHRRRVESSGKGTSSWVRGTLVMGHFKVRKTGIFWWSPHARHGYGAVTRTHVITP